MAKNIVGNLFPRILDKPLPEAKSARGVWIEDSKGHRYLDASGGAIVVNVGHGREEIAKAVYEQILSCHYVHPTMFTTRAAERLASALANHTPEGLDRFYFLSSGSEAVETAIKLARQIHLADGRPQRFRLVARWKSYHGLSLGALSAMGRTAFRVPFAPMLSDAVHIPPPYCLRCSYGLTFPACNLRCALALAETIENVGPDIVSAFIAETVSGGTLAAYPPPEGYFKIIREICDQYRILLIMDEVMCGMGRTGQWFACQQYDVIPDIITIGKGIAGGVLALSAVGLRAEHFDTVRKKSGGFMHGGSFSHHPVAAAAGLATIGILEKEKLIERVARLGIDLGLKLKERLGDHPNVADVRGIGFLWGVELVKDKNGNTPFPRHDKVAERVWEALFQKGVLVYKSTGLAGKDGDALLVAPPFVIKKDELTFVADAIKEVLADVLG
jgi:adenosylmethionine-8-amino-7-oxononanoate aminotransferase